MSLYNKAGRPTQHNSKLGSSNYTVFDSCTHKGHVTMATASAGASIKITVTDEGAGTSSGAAPYTDSSSSRGGTRGGLSPYYSASIKENHSRGQYVVKQHGNVTVTVREKHGSFRAAVPCMPLPIAVVCCILNIIAPGLGTLLSAFTVFCCGYTESATPCRAFGWNILGGLLQAVTFVFIVGWIWSISWGMTFVTLASEYRHEKRKRHQQIKYKPTSPT